MTPKYRCPHCGDWESRVVDTGPASDSNGIYRRRECEKCHGRFNTRELLEAHLIELKNLLPPISGGPASTK